MAKYPKTREQKKALSAARVATAKKVAVEGDETTVPVWYYPQFGARIQYDAPRTWSRAPRHDGQPTVAARLDVIKRGEYSFTIVDGQSLPKGFVWGGASTRSRRSCARGDDQDPTAARPTHAGVDLVVRHPHRVGAG